MSAVRGNHVPNSAPMASANVDLTSRIWPLSMTYTCRCISTNIPTDKFQDVPNNRNRYLECLRLASSNMAMIGSHRKGTNMVSHPEVPIYCCAILWNGTGYRRPQQPNPLAPAAGRSSAAIAPCCAAAERTSTRHRRSQGTSRRGQRAREAGPCRSGSRGADSVSRGGAADLGQVAVMVEEMETQPR